MRYPLPLAAVLFVAAVVPATAGDGPGTTSPGGSALDNDWTPVNTHARLSDPVESLPANLASWEADAETACAARGGIWGAGPATTLFSGMRGCRGEVGDDYLPVGGWYGSNASSQVRVYGAFVDGSMDGPWRVVRTGPPERPDLWTSVGFEMKNAAPVGPYRCSALLNHHGARTDSPELVEEGAFPASVIG